MLTFTPTMDPLKYCNSITTYKRFLTHEVAVGDILIGGQNPIRVQSMTTTDTMDTVATVEQSIRMIDAGCELVRITAPSINEAKNLANIKQELLNRGYKTPLIADIHFTPNAAEVAARIVEKVRVNPGNYADKKKFEHIDYTDETYQSELERIRDRFLPLVRICKENGTAMRIGTNHGSLSDRVMSRYGDTALGMVESAFEFLHICRDENYHNIVLSMKSSNTQVMVEAYRLLVAKMMESNMNYPLHLGVTEAGEGEDGRIKSALGIGTLLEDGIGDTIRVSLTEDPEFEIPIAKAIVARYDKRPDHDPILSLDKSTSLPYSPFEYKRRKSNIIHNIGGANVPIVVSDLSHQTKIDTTSFKELGYYYSNELDKWGIAEQACDYIYLNNQVPDFELPGTLGIILNADIWQNHTSKTQYHPLFCGFEYLKSKHRSRHLNFISVDQSIIFNSNDSNPDFLNEIKNDPTVVLILETSNIHGMAEQRRIMIEIENSGVSVPVVLKRNYMKHSTTDIQLHSATDLGGLLLDGFGDGVWLKSDKETPIGMLNKTAFGILQAARVRISKTEYISCPSCGRTLFDLQETTAKIRSRTNHLKGLKIGIMGCIVNGPGEMADADYGYVGSGPGKITLYKGKEVKQKGITSELAVDALIDLIKKNGDWVDA